MIGVDTNVIVRYLTQDDPGQAAIAARFFEQTLGPRAPGFVNNIVLCELVWVLESAYEYDRAQIAGALERLLEIDRLRFESTDFAWSALESYRGGGDFSDALMALINVAEGCDYTVTFDKRAARHRQVKLLAR